MVYTLRFFSSKCSLFRNSNVFGSCIIHILCTGCAKIKKKILAPKGYIKFIQKLTVYIPYTKFYIHYFSNVYR